MLWGLGDGKNALLSTSKVVESVVKRRMGALIQKADSVSKKHGCDKISLKDILHALKDDKSKLTRLIDYLGKCVVFFYCSVFY